MACLLFKKTLKFYWISSNISLNWEFLWVRPSPSKSITNLTLWIPFIFKLNATIITNATNTQGKNRYMQKECKFHGYLLSNKSLFLRLCCSIWSGNWKSRKLYFREARFGALVSTFKLWQDFIWSKSISIRLEWEFQPCYWANIIW